MTRGPVDLKIVDDRLAIVLTPEELYGVVRGDLDDLARLAEGLRQAAARLARHG